MIELKSGEMQSSDSSISLKRWGINIEPATIITIILGFTFYIGWAYTNSYFERLGIPHDSLEFSASFYMLEAFWLIVIILGLFMLLFIAAKNPSKTKKKALLANFLFPILAIPYIYLAIYVNYFFIIFSIFFCIIWIHRSWEKTSVPYQMNQTFIKRVFSIIYVLIFILLFISVWGDYRAIITIEGTSSNVQMINFSWKGIPPEGIKDKELVFIIYHEGNYYVVNKQKPAPEVPEIYIIPGDQIEYAVIKNINYNLLWKHI